MGKNDDDVPVTISKNRARGAVTGHHVRYVLAFGLAGIVIAFVARPWSLLQAPRELRPQGSEFASQITNQSHGTGRYRGSRTKGEDLAKWTQTKKKS